MAQSTDDRFGEFQEWVLYDGQCGFCLGWIERSASVLHSHGFGLAPLQSEWVRNRLKLSEEHLLDEMRVITLSNQVFGGADAFLYLAQKIWWAWPLYAVSYVPGVKALIRWTYRFIAKNRNRFGAHCRLGERK